MSFSDRLFGSPRDRFAASVLDALKALGHAGLYVADDFRIDVTVAGDPSPVRLYLANTFAECEGAPMDERAVRIAALIAITERSQVPDTWDGIRPMLRPVLRRASFAMGVDGPMRTPLSRPAMPLLIELVVIDLPSTMEYVGASRLGEWGVSADDVFDAAHANLARTAEYTSGRDAVEKPAAIRFVESGAAYYSSLPLIPGWLAAMRKPAGGKPFAFVIEHNGLMVVGVRESQRNVSGWLDLAYQEYDEANRPISPLAYTVDDAGNVVEYDVPAGHPDRPAVRRAQTALTAAVYGAQAEALRVEYMTDLVDVFVASVIQAASKADGTPFTAAAWTDGIQSSLPRTHYVVLGDDPVLVPFDAVVEIMGLRPTEGLYPERYRVGGWPDAETMARLLARAEEP
jgi:hypothetical protein